MTESTFTLEELADAFELTPRNARHWIENILPPHHKKGRGALARYGRDTFNCFAFVQKAREEKLTSAQIARVLSQLGQDQIDRIAEGAEQLQVLDMLAAPLVEESADPPPPASASARARRHAAMSQPVPDSLPDYDAPRLMRSEMVHSDSRWNTLYEDEELQIRFRGKADREQRRQVQKAAELIRSILGR